MGVTCPTLNMRNAYKVLVGKPKRSNHLEDMSGGSEGSKS
jgi:hypothetical protein